MTRLLAALLLLLVAGCGSSGDEHTTLHVLAAASLTQPFGTLAHDFEKSHPGVQVQLDLGPSSGLAQQIQQGAPADVFASASTSTMDTVVGSGDAGTPKDFAVNSMEIAVPPGNPARIRSVVDLARAGVKVALCQPQVPCGAVAAQVFANAGVRVRPATEEVDVKSVLTKVRLGEVDAGMVYVTDVRAAGSAVRGVPVPGSVNARTTYPIATLKASTSAELARAFVALVLSHGGRAVLRRDGFETP